MAIIRNKVIDAEKSSYIGWRIAKTTDGSYGLFPIDEKEGYDLRENVKAYKVIENISQAKVVSGVASTMAGAAVGTLLLGPLGFVAGSLLSPSPKKKGVRVKLTLINGDWVLIECDEDIWSNLKSYYTLHWD